MRGALLLLLLLTATSRTPDRQAQFAETVQPILEGRCQPCHFTGGQMHHELPFDRHETIDRLGTKLFSRIKEEKERAVIRNFLESRPSAPVSETARSGRRGRL